MDPTHYRYRLWVEINGRTFSAGLTLAAEEVPTSVPARRRLLDTLQQQLAERLASQLDPEIYIVPIWDAFAPILPGSAHWDALARRIFSITVNGDRLEIEIISPLHPRERRVAENNAKAALARQALLRVEPMADVKPYTPPPRAPLPPGLRDLTVRATNQ